MLQAKRPDVVLPFVAAAPIVVCSSIAPGV
jgi:hypothetical protein